jgi:hypothetical protein
VPWFFFSFFLLLKGRGVEVNVFFRLHICSRHYAHKVAGWRLFDHKKPYCNAKLFESSGKLFFSKLFFTFCYFFTACNFHKLFFTVEKGQGYYFIIFTSLFKGSWCTYTYDLTATPAGTRVGGCLTAKKGPLWGLINCKWYNVVIIWLQTLLLYWFYIVFMLSIFCIYVVLIFFQHHICIACALLNIGDAMLQQHNYKLDIQYWLDVIFLLFMLLFNHHFSIF